jgi:hypothetical protein
MREEGEESATGPWRGSAPEQESFLMREEGQESVMGFKRSSMPPRAGLAERSLDDQANIIHNLLLNINDDCRRVIIIKLVSDSEIRRSIEEVLHSLRIEQATFNKSLVNWKGCTRPYAVDLHAFRNHGTNKSTLNFTHHCISTTMVPTRVPKTVPTTGPLRYSSPIPSPSLAQIKQLSKHTASPMM